MDAKKILFASNFWSLHLPLVSKWFSVVHLESLSWWREGWWLGKAGKRELRKEVRRQKLINCVLLILQHYDLNRYICWLETRGNRDNGLLSLKFKLMFLNESELNVKLNQLPLAIRKMKRYTLVSLWCVLLIVKD